MWGRGIGGSGRYLFELMDAEYSPCVFAMGSCFFPVACAVAGISGEH
jgi:hypothetical protein